jgi:hypothetical protein
MNTGFARYSIPIAAGVRSCDESAKLPAKNPVTAELAPRFSLEALLTKTPSKLRGYAAARPAPTPPFSSGMMSSVSMPGTVRMQTAVKNQT